MPLIFPGTGIACPDASPSALHHATTLLRRAFDLNETETPPGLRLDVAGGPWADVVPAERPDGPWMWAQLDGPDRGYLIASSPALVYALAGLLADGQLDHRSEALAEGLFLEPTFTFHRPLYDHVLAQVSRTTRSFEPEPYVAALARAGFTHAEVNNLAFHIPFEPGVPTEYYNQFYAYCAGFNHFVDSTLTRGLYPAEYLQANLNRMRKTAELVESYGLKPGMLSFEPRSLPEHFFQRYPTLRGARIDHPYRSHLPRYTLAQDHPVAREHYREVMTNLMEAVPSLSYLSVWTNDSGAGFEHTSSLYVGRNGGPYLIREWREHDQIAETAAKSALRWLRLIRETAAAINPEFEVLLRIEPFKAEHDHILEGLGDGLSFEAPSLLVRGYDLPYHHPRYEEQQSAAGTVFHTDLEDREGELLAEHRERGFEPKLTYSPSSSFNHEPLLGIPFPKMLHQKLSAMRAQGFRGASAFGGLLNIEQTPYWPNPAVIRAAQFTPEERIEDVLTRYATQLVGAEDAGTVTEAWDRVEEALSYVPIVPLYSNFGFVWLRTWVRPLVPNLEAIPETDRLYYERFMVSTSNNPNINDLGRDVLFELFDEDGGRRMARQFDENVFPRLTETLSALDEQRAATDNDRLAAVLTDLRDRVEALLCWTTTQRNTCAWVAGVYGYRRADSDEARTEHRRYLDAMIDLDVANTRRLLELWETAETEFILVSDVGETSFIFGENLGELLRRKLELTEQYRDAEPAIDESIMWKLP